MRNQESRGTLTHHEQAPNTWGREAGELLAAAALNCSHPEPPGEGQALAGGKAPRPVWSPFESGRSRAADANVSPGRTTRKPQRCPSFPRRAAPARNKRSAQDSPQAATPAMTTSGSWAGRYPEAPLPGFFAIPPSCHVLTLSTAHPRGHTRKRKGEQEMTCDLFSPRDSLLFPVSGEGGAR